jgi:hypothetical protein
MRQPDGHVRPQLTGSFHFGWIEGFDPSLEFSNVRGKQCGRNFTDIFGREVHRFVFSRNTRSSSAKSNLTTLPVLPTKTEYGGTTFSTTVSDVTAGEMGGFVESERNLSQNGDAWAGGDAKVSGDARWAAAPSKQRASRLRAKRAAA